VNNIARADLIAQIGGGSPTSAPEGPRPLQTARDPRVDASQQNIRYILQAAQFWANEHSGRLPPDLGSLLGYPNITLSTFINPRGNTQPPSGTLTDEQQRAWINASTDYIYLGANLRSSGPAGAVVIYENLTGMSGGLDLGFLDGSTRFREMRWALDTLLRAGT
jgi:hypothetical protein